MDAAANTVSTYDYGTRSIPLLPLDEMIPGQEADVFLLLVGQGRTDDEDGQALSQSDVSRRQPGSELSDLGRCALGGRMPRRVDAGRVLQSSGRSIARRISARSWISTKFARSSRPTPPTVSIRPPASRNRDSIRRKCSRNCWRSSASTSNGRSCGNWSSRFLTENRKEILVFPAARHNHHAFVGGLLEHTLSVTKTALFLADKYADYYPDMQPPLDKSMVVAGAILHDIGKLREYEPRPEGAIFSAEGAMIGHMLLGRDIVREAAAKLKTPLDAETLLRLEHAIIAHQRLPEWGSPKPPMTPEAMLIHYADDIDAKFHIMMSVLRDDTNPGPVTSKKNLMMQHVYRGMTKYVGQVSNLSRENRIISSDKISFDRLETCPTWSQAFDARPELDELCGRGVRSRGRDGGRRG